jgi:hypothetical protein
MIAFTTWALGLVATWESVPASIRHPVDLAVTGLVFFGLGYLKGRF